jgi:surfactin synthase thioesterase subunit
VTDWLDTLHRPPAPVARLVCVPYAGGGTHAFAGWPPHLPTGCLVEAVALPGRGRRFREPLADDLLAVAEAVATEVTATRPRPEVPTVLLGHSMGALVAFEAARLLEPGAIDHVIVSGRAAPGTGRTPSGWGDLDDDDAVGLLRSLGGTPPELLDNDELLALSLPVLRADFTMADRYHFQPWPVLHCPLTAIIGERDDHVGRAAAEAWQATTTGPFQLHVVPGDHFFLHTETAAVTGIVTTILPAGVARGL